MVYGYGIIGWFDVCVEEVEFKVYVDVQCVGMLKVYMSVGFYVNLCCDLCEQVECFVVWCCEYECDNLCLYMVKIFVDGVFELKIVVLFELYVGIDDCGFVLWSQDVLNEICLFVDMVGFDLYFYMFVDCVVCMMFDVFEIVQCCNGMCDWCVQFVYL